jgi:hypothetical protein
MKIPFERVVKNLELGRYRGKITSADSANLGIQRFDEVKFADQLGVTCLWLHEIGLMKNTDQCGWILPKEPTVDALLSYEGLIKQKAL